MVKIQRMKAYDYKDHSIYRYRLDIPSGTLEKLGWDESTHVDIKVLKNKLVIIRMD